MGTYDPVNTAGYYCYCDTNSTPTYSWPAGEEREAARKAFWAEMRRNRVPWWRRYRRPASQQAVTRPATVIHFPCQGAARKASGRRYGGLKAALRKLAA